MLEYFIHTEQDEDGDYEVHDKTCPVLPDEENRIPLGSFYTCVGAVIEARVITDLTPIDGCGVCSPTCHSS